MHTYMLKCAYIYIDIHKYKCVHLIAFCCFFLNMHRFLRNHDNCYT